MPKYTRVAKGVAFKNKDKTQDDNKPDYSGPKFEIELDGKTHEISAAIWESTAKTGSKYFSIQLTKVEEENGK
tara:strand:- start:62 stop:280 length:219 start_codon:yes stop_codon:yes gene_type:complete